MPEAPYFPFSLSQKGDLRYYHIRSNDVNFMSYFKFTLPYNGS
ncbi:hypothetical protein BAGQ_4042 [Bacillus sp. CN2]|nr:hypothetical protein BAGQ_4042 [Bacillus velezensis]GFR55325.1 hypothetical protein BAGQ_4042 [Bacillus sp. CN2]